MASPIIGALYFGLFAGSASPGLPVDHIAMNGIPSPQCVICGPANSHSAARVYDWSRGRIMTRAEALREGRLGIAQDALQTDEHVGMTEAQLQRFSGGSTS